MYGLYKDTAIFFVLLQYLFAPKGQRLFSENGYSVSWIPLSSSNDHSEPSVLWE